ncbi:MarR family winged helix-turn-helix transcriptional regulator [Microbacterium sp. SORGH_AS_0888]|uniref:MarR family winged helix-turn-helix transcriptional regulator n=1 Tax=Microbacterium sp. SORGH_AS_0888 TaxID=3041791 RepID=UPI002780A4AC|nr:MarR family transcriptional regulator [Microbacterium sp. SORGH_AS_0888]MDQ1127978.1 DNA-binding MarR family transcriptional regulator [Microbacterium sp. SORGH_AS_0888]
MPDTEESTRQESVARATERLRLAESRLARRRQTDCGPSENARAAMRFVYERSDADEDVTPTAIAEHLGVSTAAVTGILDRLRAGGLVTFRAHPSDGRSKLVVPVDRSVDLDDIDPLTAKIRRLSAGLSEEAMVEIAGFLDAVADEVDQECV